VLCLIGRVTTVVALCLAVGLHWLALQSIAWTAMIVQNAKQASFCEAVKRTFDGAHPCDLCKRISKAKGAEKKHDNQCRTVKADLICVVRQFALLPHFAPVDYFALVSSLVGAPQQPPSPPPRAELA
jgi:hypothetical protein